MRPDGRERPLRFRLGQWMILNIYLALILGSVVLVARMKWGVARLLTFIGVTIGLPWLLRFITLLLIRPSPRRDTLTFVFGMLSTIAMSIWLVLFLSLFELEGRKKLGALSWSAFPMVFHILSGAWSSSGSCTSLT